MRWLQRAAILSLFSTVFGSVACTGGQITAPSHDLGGEDAAASPDLPSTSGDLRAPAADLTGVVATPDLAGSPDLTTSPTTIGPFTLTFDLAAGAFPAKPGQPSVLVYIPSGFRAEPPYDLIVYVHGFNNCVVNVVKETGGTCSTGGATRGASNLINQLEDTNKNAILVVPEVKFEQASGDPGKLGTTDGLKNFLAELLPKLEPQLGPAGLADIGNLLLMSHSGGYWALAKMATIGGVPVDEVHLLDSLYGYESTFQDWIELDPAAHAMTPPLRRFFSVYTAGGGTDDNNMAMATGAASWSWFDQDARLYDNTTSTWTPDQYLHGAMWKRSSLSHSGVVLYYFQQLIQTSPLLSDKP